MTSNYFRFCAYYTDMAYFIRAGWVGAERTSPWIMLMMLLALGGFNLRCRSQMRLPASAFCSTLWRMLAPISARQVMCQSISKRPTATLSRKRIRRRQDPAHLKFPNPSITLSWYSFVCPLGVPNQTVSKTSGSIAIIATSVFCTRFQEAYSRPRLSGTITGLCSGDGQNVYIWRCGAELS
ncbi:hypothetical protein ACGC1H_006148 [Rhizoctonia solani]